MSAIRDSDYSSVMHSFFSRQCHLQRHFSCLDVENDKCQSESLHLADFSTLPYKSPSTPYIFKNSGKRSKYGLKYQVTMQWRAINNAPENLFACVMARSQSFKALQSRPELRKSDVFAILFFHFFTTKNILLRFP